MEVEIYEGNFFDSSFLDWIKTTKAIAENYLNQGYRSKKSARKSDQGTGENECESSEEVEDL